MDWCANASPSGNCWRAVLSILQYARYNTSVKFRHTAAVALTGWYLIAPPYVPSSTKPPPPLYKWTRLQEFDDQAHCDKEFREQKAVRIEPSAADSNNWSGRWGEGETKLQQCVAADDPRLKGK